MFFIFSFIFMPLLLVGVLLVNRTQSNTVVHFLLFIVLSFRRQLSHNRGRATNTVRLGLGLGLVHGCDFADLVQIAFEDGGIREFFGGFRQLEEHDAGADLQKAQDDGCDGFSGGCEALEEDGRGDDCRAGEEHIVRWGDQSRVEDVQCFLFLLAFAHRDIGLRITDGHRERGRELTFK